MKKVYLMSLGCPRNLVDSEVLEGLLKKKGFILSDKYDKADIAIVNTCGFIKDAKEESIQAILGFADLKKRKKIKKLIVTGCLSQRYPKDLIADIKEIDAVYGSSDFTRIPGDMDAVMNGEKISTISKTPSFIYDDTYSRVSETPEHYYYLKIQEGCSNRCSYCVIPDIRGPLRSREVNSILREVKKACRSKALKEILVIGQDITSYGFDRKKKDALPPLLKKISRIAGKNRWIRLLYMHPAHFTDELIETIAETQNICKYVDLPIQHINGRILKSMNRKVSKKDIIELISRLRKNIDGVVLRTSVIVGYPKETKKEFNELLGFIRAVKFDRLGAFMYSKEEGTRAAALKGHVSEKEKQSRYNSVMALQQEISAEKNYRLIGKKFNVLVEGKDSLSKGTFTGRTYMDAPEIDTEVYVKGKGLKAGDFVRVKITGSTEYDLTGETI